MSEHLKISLDGLGPKIAETAEIRPGSICRTRQGKLYLCVTIPGPSRDWRTSEYMYYFTLGRDGEVLRPGQCLLGYAQENWEVIGHADITIGEPEWYL